MEPPLWLGAASLAARAHRHQLRKDGVTPYVAHVVRVAMVVRDVFGCADPVALAAAYLHDTIEDSDIDYDDLLSQFGREVADCVAALTKNKALEEATREAEYDVRLAKAPWQARLVKLADAYDNFLDVESTEGPQRSRLVSKAVERCKRALKLAAPDAQRSEVATAIRVIQQLVRQ